MSTHNLNDDTKGAFRVTLRAVAKPGLALSCDAGAQSHCTAAAAMSKRLNDNAGGVLRQRQARTRDRAVTAGSLSHSTPAARGCWLIACVRTTPPTRSKCPRWHASAHSSAGAGCSLHSRTLPSRCVLGSVTHCGPTLSRTPTVAIRARRLLTTLILTTTRSGMRVPKPSRVPCPRAQRCCPSLASGGTFISGMQGYKRCKTRCEARAGAECGLRERLIVWSLIACVA